MHAPNRLRIHIVAAAVAALLAAGSVQAQWLWRPGDTASTRFRLTLFEPNGSSEAWDALYAGFSGSPSDLSDLGFGLDFRWMLGRNSGIQFGFSFSEGSSTSEYTEWVAGDGTAIRHQKSLELGDLTVLWVLRPGDGRAVSPYLGIGGGFLWYELSEAGDFIDFGSADLPIVRTGYFGDGTTFELLGVVGLDVRLAGGWSFLAEGRWREAEDDLGGDYGGYGKLDLSGWELSAGFAFNF